MPSLHICGLDSKAINNIVDKWKDTLDEVDCTIESSGLYRPTLCLIWDDGDFSPTDEVCDFVKTQFRGIVNVVSVVNAIKSLRNNETLQFTVNK